MTEKEICGAKNRKGEICQQKPMKNGRCRFHGGKSTGVKGNQNARKHGAYSKFFTDDEKAQLDELELDNLNSELQLCKIQLIRALEAQEKQLKANDNDKMELIAQTIQAVKDGEQIARQQVNKSFAKTDFGGIIDRLIGRIQSLTHSVQDMQSKAIDMEMKQIELDKLKAKEAENQALPVKVVIQVEDARKYDESEIEHTAGEIPANAE
ncbi:HGGxSTG domain-containing protein [Moraxella sp. ZY210820]|uniref:HGGxSTG domain-containing protein n=1 Tax=Moraxella sp. ZY210820 TaxID=2904123 RepID=UPI0027316EA4|nr:HGGxSTG domain-containing protein [Moraxella sp. ZY210820]WLF84826.1 hypothetical protein LU301_05015 [Moraxella sp. ZY210820]